MKTSSNSSSRPERNYSLAAITRARQYATNALLSPILRPYYTRLAEAMKFRDASDAAFHDYLENPKLRGLDKKL